MQKVRLIYNPCAGDTTFRNKLDTVVERFQANGYQVIPFKALQRDDIAKGVMALNEEPYHALIVAGGDGTVHQAINAMMAEKIDIPLGIIPAGTANDFAAYLNMPRSVEKCCDVLLRGRTKRIDLGLANGRYFINVASAGLLTDVSQKVDVHLKNFLGKIAYYIKGVEQIPNFRPLKIEINSEERTINEKIFLLLVLNGTSAGGLNRIAPNAAADDGKLDVIVVRNCYLPNLVALLLKILKGEHLNDPFIYYFQTEGLTIACEMEGCAEQIPTDLDGEGGPPLPLQVSVAKGALSVLINEE